MKIHVDKDGDSDFKFQPDIPKCTQRNPILESGPKSPLAEKLEKCPADIDNRNHLATTQLRDGNIDMDQQEIPRTNRKKIGAPFSQRRL